MRKRIGTAVALAATAAVMAPSPASAETLTLAMARSETSSAAALAVDAGDATSFRILRCRRLSPTHVHCRVRFRNVRRQGRTCQVTFSVSVHDENFTTFPSRAVCHTARQS